MLHGFILIFREVYWLYHIRVPQTPTFVALARAVPKVPTLSSALLQGQQLVPTLSSAFLHLTWWLGFQAN